MLATRLSDSDTSAEDARCAWKAHRRVVYLASLGYRFFCAQDPTHADAALELGADGVPDVWMDVAYLYTFSLRRTFCGICSRMWIEDRDYVTRKMMRPSVASTDSLPRPQTPAVPLHASTPPQQPFSLRFAKRGDVFDYVFRRAFSDMKAALPIGALQRRATYTLPLRRNPPDPHGDSIVEYSQFNNHIFKWFEGTESLSTRPSLEIQCILLREWEEGRFAQEGSYWRRCVTYAVGQAWRDLKSWESEEEDLFWQVC